MQNMVDAVGTLPLKLSGITSVAKNSNQEQEEVEVQRNTEIVRSSHKRGGVYGGWGGVHGAVGGMGAVEEIIQMYKWMMNAPFRSL